MAKKISIFILLVVLLCAVSLQAAESAYVDKDSAQAEIQDMTDENTKLTDDNKSLEEENNKMSANIITMRALITDQVVPLNTSVTQKVSEIRALMTNIVDDQMRAQAADALQRGLTLIRKLELKKQLLETSIFQANSKINENKNTINRNNQKIEKNNESIAYLDESIRNTEDQNSLLQEYISSVSDFITNAEGLVSDVNLSDASNAYSIIETE